MTHHPDPTDWLNSQSFDAWLATLDDEQLRRAQFALESAAVKAGSLTFARYLAHSSERCSQAVGQGVAL